MTQRGWKDVRVGNDTSRRLRMMVLVILSFVAAASGQNQKAPSELLPSTLYYLDSYAQLVPLESKIVRRKTDYRALGFAGGSIVYFVDGEKSPVRLKAAGKLEFVVRLKQRTDPLETIQFYRFAAANGSRVLPVETFNPLGGVSRFTLNTGTVDFNAAAYGASSFKLTPIEALAPGEYCLVIKPTNQWPGKSPGFCFGVELTATSPEGRQ
jgi:hypothetical protein